MKMSLVVTMFLASVSVFGAELSEFERGFLEGKATCHDSAAPASGYNCLVQSSAYYVAANGRTKAEALLKIDPKALAAAYQEGKPPSCYPLQ